MTTTRTADGPACDLVLVAGKDPLEDGVSALLVESGSVDGLAAALERALGDPGLRRSLARAGRGACDTRFSAAAFSTALEATYASLGFPARGSPESPGMDRPGASATG